MTAKNIELKFFKYKVLRIQSSIVLILNTLVLYNYFYYTQL